MNQTQTLKSTEITRITTFEFKVMDNAVEITKTVDFKNSYVPPLTHWTKSMTLLEAEKFQNMLTETGYTH